MLFPGFGPYQGDEAAFHQFEFEIAISAAFDSQQHLGVASADGDDHYSAVAELAAQRGGDLGCSGGDQDALEFERGGLIRPALAAIGEGEADILQAEGG